MYAVWSGIAFATVGALLPVVLSLTAIVSPLDQLRPVLVHLKDVVKAASENDNVVVPSDKLNLESWKIAWLDPLLS